MPIQCIVTGVSGTRRVDFSRPVHLAIPLHFEGEQPNAFGLPRASSQPFEAGSFVGDVRRGGSVNCSTVTLHPHGNGTHTECVGHITKERFYVHECLEECLFQSVLVSVPLCQKKETLEHGCSCAEPEDWLVTRAALEAACQDAPEEWMNALVIRSLPNTEEKKRRTYNAENAAYLSVEAAQYIRERGVQHLLVDFPSVDRGEDGGELLAHHLFWSSKGHSLPVEKEALKRTITEMIFVPEQAKDGLYVLSLQIAPFLLDAAPSRPILFPTFSCS